MTDSYTTLSNTLAKSPKRWLVTGAAGFIGSHLCEELLLLGQEVIGLDNFATGKHENIEFLLSCAQRSATGSFNFIEGDLVDPEACAEACQGCDHLLHQGALGSVPRSIESPEISHRANVDGTVNIFLAARAAGIRRVVYASSSSVYGDEPNLPKVEARIGNPLSPYAATKRICEVYAAAYASSYAMEFVGLRYFNVFGPRQDPEGAYAAVIPRWIAAMIRREPVLINGDGETSRDFCYVKNVVRANLLAATCDLPPGSHHALNIACGQRTTLKELFGIIRAHLEEAGVKSIPDPKFQPFRVGDVRHSLADISLVQSLLGYEPREFVVDGLRLAVGAYLARLSTTVA